MVAAPDGEQIAIATSVVTQIARVVLCIDEGSGWSEIIDAPLSRLRRACARGACDVNAVKAPSVADRELRGTRSPPGSSELKRVRDQPSGALRPQIVASFARGPILLKRNRCSKSENRGISRMDTGTRLQIILKVGL
jgi:hypothetical protein